MEHVIVIYHGGCRDGFCSAWVVNRYFKEKFHSSDLEVEEQVTYHPGFYGQEPPDCEGKDVIIVDFAYDLGTMKKIAETCKTLTWLDHHKTAQPIADYFKQYEGNDVVKYDFDNSRSGAGIAWDYLFGDRERPWLVDYVEDRDLWLKKLPDTDIINNYVACLEFDFEVWDRASKTPIDLVKDRGIWIQQKTEQYVREVCKNVYFTTLSDSPITNPELFYRNIPVVNICQVDCSEVLHELCKKYPQASFSMYWFRRQDGLYQYGLRSIGDFDVSHVAKLYNGGGHKNAAGFQLPYLLEELK